MTLTRSHTLGRIRQEVQDKDKGKVGRQQTEVFDLNRWHLPSHFLAETMKRKKPNNDRVRRS
jgi:hypothetical protein